MNKELHFDDTLASVKYNKTLKTLPLCLYESIQLFFVTNIALHFASCYICCLTLISAVYFKQTGGSALSNTYSHSMTC